VAEGTGRREQGDGDAVLPGRLVLVGTPIGNLQDVTPRSLDELRAADVVCAEDTRRARKLLSAFDIHPRRLHSIRAHNEQKEAARAVRWIAEGRRVAYVSDAGMPVVSDPGERLARAVIDAGGQVAVCPGPDAATAALLVSGFPRHRWCFEGFVPAKGAERARRLDGIAAEDATVVVFEAPHRLHRTLTELADRTGDERQVVVANDLTKLFEQQWRGSIGAVAEQVGATALKGEFVIVLAPPPGAEPDGATRRLRT
jgi:16S rRNA (cytidine1402-2'-O)-methyltransferase